MVSAGSIPAYPQKEDTMELNAERFYKSFKADIKNAKSVKDVWEVEKRYREILYFVWFSREKEVLARDMYEMARKKELGLQFRIAKSKDTNFTQFVKDWSTRLKDNDTYVLIYPEREHNFYWEWRSGGERIMNGGFIFHGTEYRSHT